MLAEAKFGRISAPRISPRVIFCSRIPLLMPGPGQRVEPLGIGGVAFAVATRRGQRKDEVSFEAYGFPRDCLGIGNGRPVNRERDVVTSTLILIAALINFGQRDRPPSQSELRI